MTKPITVQNTFALASGNVPASQLDADFSTAYSSINDLGTYSQYSADTGSANAYVISFPAGVTATLSTGLPVTFIPANTNTGACTINVAGTGVVPLVTCNNQPLPTGTIVVGQLYTAIYNATLGKWLLQSAFLSSVLGVTGWEYSPNGILRQWGSVVVGTNSSGGGSVGFPTLFPNNVYRVNASVGDINASILVIQQVQASLNTSGFSLTAYILPAGTTYNSSNIRINWDAIGN